MNLGVLASHEGTTLQSLLDAFAGGAFRASTISEHRRRAEGPKRPEDIRGRNAWRKLDGRNPFSSQGLADHTLTAVAPCLPPPHQSRCSSLLSPLTVSADVVGDTEGWITQSSAATASDSPYARTRSTWTLKSDHFHGFRGSRHNCPSPPPDFRPPPGRLMRRISCFGPFSVPALPLPLREPRRQTAGSPTSRRSR